MSKQKQVSRVGFLSFFKLTLLFGLAFGQIAGVVALMFGIYRWPIHLTLGSWKMEGLPASIGIMILLPPAFGLVSFFAAPILFLPFTLACHVLGGFKVSHGN